MSKEVIVEGHNTTHHDGSVAVILPADTVRAFMLLKLKE